MSQCKHIVEGEPFVFFSLLLTWMSFCTFVLTNDVPSFWFLLQVIAGELELKECNLNWSPEDFESKLQVRASFYQVRPSAYQAFKGK